VLLNVLRRMQLEFDDALVGQGRQLKFSFLWFSQVFSKKPGRAFIVGFDLFCFNSLSTHFRQPSARPTKKFPGRFQTFRALRHRDFRLLWIGLVVSAVGTWMQIVARSLLVLKMTQGSALALGAVSLIQAFSFFVFALFGGSIADRFDKRRLLFFTQSTSAVLAVVLGILTITGTIQFWLILLVTFLDGTVLSFDQPARGALVPALVPPEDLMNALSLQSMVHNGASMLGPALAGVAVGLVGYAGNFFLNAASFLGVLIALYLMRVPARGGGPDPQPVIAAIRAGLRTVRSDTVLPWILSGYASLLFLGPSAALILPVFAVTVLHLDPERMGLLFSSSGVGTILGALILGSLGDPARKGYLYFSGLLIWVCALIVFALSGWLWLSMIALVLSGVGQTFTGTTTITLLQTRVPEQMRGRVMSLNTLLIMGVRPLGDFPAGALISAVGAPDTVLLSAGLVGGYSALVFLIRRSIRSV
jgi:predicted MFS family arabinose efflux permease